MSPINLAIVGVGKIVRDQHLPAVAKNGDYKLIAAASRHGVVDGIDNFKSIDEMLATVPAIQAVSLCMPPQYRYEAAEKALSAGKHVFLEKPPGATLSEVADLSKEDLLFVDSSHRTFQNSDVTVFLLEILPSLPAGLAYGVHDVFLPADYPDAWADRFYSEQYLLASYLQGGGDGDEVMLPHAYLCMETELPKLLQPLFDRLDLPSEQRVGSAFWLRRSPSRA